MSASFEPLSDAEAAEAAAAATRAANACAQLGGRRPAAGTRKRRSVLFKPSPDSWTYREFIEGDEDLKLLEEVRLSLLHDAATKAQVAARATSAAAAAAAAAANAAAAADAGAAADATVDGERVISFDDWVKQQAAGRSHSVRGLRESHLAELRQEQQQQQEQQPISEPTTTQRAKAGERR